MFTRKLAVTITTTTLVLGAILASACSSGSEEAAPSRPPVPPVVADDASVSADGGGSDVDAAACNGPAGCFACEPVSELDFLNACTDGSCTPFDNVARLPLYKAGQPLPAVP
ncbi:MAG: hypothetical protein JWP97_6132 [Labilithrix sp.]|nr:hypothetical protein [Labilithrix sp.]